MTYDPLVIIQANNLIKLNVERQAFDRPQHLSVVRTFAIFSSVIVHKGETCPGTHGAIVEESLSNKVQETLALTAPRRNTGDTAPIVREGDFARRTKLSGARRSSERTGLSVDFPCLQGKNREIFAFWPNSESA